MVRVSDLIRTAIAHKSALDSKSASFRFAVRAYDNLIKLLSGLPKTIDSIDNLPISQHMKYRLANPPEIHNVLTDLQTIQGIGLDKAKELVELGVQSLDDLRKKKFFDLLPIITQVYIKYRPLSVIPRKMIDSLKEKIIWDPSTQFIVGSYRRELQTSRDIDIMVIGNKKTLDAFIDHLAQQLQAVIYAQGNDKVSTLVKFMGKYVKLDVFRCSREEEPAMLLYSTGSKQHNILMRQEAKKLGLVLNQRGLFKSGKKIPIKTEKGFFDALNMKYVEPKNRHPS
jgi:DNA polymerase/3'-5' exonuclease PolX